MDLVPLFGAIPLWGTFKSPKDIAQLTVRLKERFFKILNDAL